MNHHLIVNKKTFFKVILIFSIFTNTNQIFSQKKESFIMFKGGNKYIKPIKYIFFNTSRDKISKLRTKIVFQIKNEKFIFNEKQHEIDSCNISFLNKINLSKPEKLSDLEFDFFKNKINEINKTRTKKIPSLMPVSKNHKYFKVYILKKECEKILKYEVDWPFSHNYH